MGLEAVLDLVILGNWDLSLKREKFQDHPAGSITTTKGALIKKRLTPGIKTIQHQSGHIKRMFNFISLIKDPPANLNLPKISSRQGHLILPFLKDPLYKKSEYFLR